MKIVVTHSSPDLDAITSVWLIKRFLPNWADAGVEFVYAGGRSDRIKNPNLEEVIEKTEDHEIIHVDTGLGPLDHHQTSDTNVCGASRTWEYVIQNSKFKVQNSEKETAQKEAIDRIVKIIVDYDHFKEVFLPDPTRDIYEFTLEGVLEGLKLLKPDQDDYYVEFISNSLDALVHNFENRIWAEKEIKQNGIVFDLPKGKGLPAGRQGIGFETINDTVVKLAQIMGFVIVIRKDPRKGYVRIKTRPQEEKSTEINLTLAYEQLKKMDPEATWFLHVSKKMLLNGSVKNPDMRPTSLSLDAIIEVVKSTV